MTRLELGGLYIEQGGALRQRFIGGCCWMAQQIKQGGYADPTAAQIAWADAVISASDLLPFANAVLKWGLVNNTTLQGSGISIDDNAVDYIVSESAKSYT